MTGPRSFNCPAAGAAARKMGADPRSPRRVGPHPIRAPEGDPAPARARAVRSGENATGIRPAATDERGRLARELGRINWSRGAPIHPARVVRYNLFSIPESTGASGERVDCAVAGRVGVPGGVDQGLSHYNRRIPGRGRPHIATAGGRGLGTQWSAGRRKPFLRELSHELLGQAPYAPPTIGGAHVHQ